MNVRGAYMVYNCLKTWHTIIHIDIILCAAMSPFYVVLFTRVFSPPYTPPPSLAYQASLEGECEHGRPQLVLNRSRGGYHPSRSPIKWSGEEESARRQKECDWECDWELYRRVRFYWRQE